MILNSIYLKIGDFGLPVELTYGFLKRTRFICNYMERECLKKIKFSANGFKRVVISLCHFPKNEVFVNSSKVAVVEVGYRLDEFARLSGLPLAYYHIQKIREGLRKASSFIAIPEAELGDCLADFVDGGCTNVWVHKTRKFRKIDVDAKLSCELNQDNFILRLTIVRAGSILFNDVILETDPDENAFEYRFKEIELKGDKLVVSSNTSDFLKMIDLNDFN